MVVEVKFEEEGKRERRKSGEREAAGSAIVWELSKTEGNVIIAGMWSTGPVLRRYHTQRSKALR